MLQPRRFWTAVCLAPVLVCAATAEAQERTVVVPANAPWTDTGIDVQQGQPLRIDAEGEIRFLGLGLGDWAGAVLHDRRGQPQGTYRWPADYRPRQPLPLAAMAEGPWPAFCLIGKIGEDGEPFYVGSRWSGAVARSGRLWLGINDDRFSDNAGKFTVRVAFSAEALAAAGAPAVLGASAGRPVEGARVLLLYVDGLRADVLQAMAQQGFLPNFKEAFLDRGVWVPNAFTVFPSNTLIANGSLFTGRFSDGTGIKSQNQFERSTLKMRGQFSDWLPDGFMPKPRTRILNLLDKYAPENTHAFLLQRGVPTLASRLGKAFRSTTLPIAPLNPPPQWLHAAVNKLGPFGLSVRLPRRLDEVNARYAADVLFDDPDVRVAAVWFPMADKTCHHSAHGQWGAARRDLALADEYLGWIIRRLKQLRRYASTYFILVSDHGHLGGESSVNRVCNLPRDWAHRALGLNAKVVGQEWIHPGQADDRFVFFDNQGAGQAKIFLPHGAYFTGPWKRNRLHELMQYQIRPGQEPVNLLQSLESFRPPGWQAGEPAPIDLIMVKLDEQRVLIHRHADCQAVIHREKDVHGREVYRYVPVRRTAQSVEGALDWQQPLPGTDPFGYLQDDALAGNAGAADWLAQAHDDRDWLSATQHSRYPDAVVAIAKFFAWRQPLSDLAELRDPDILVTASEGWSLRSDGGEGTDHGYPLAGSMRIALFFAGANIRHGVLESPQRIVDVLPTVLDMAGWAHDPSGMDGQPVRNLYE